MKKLLVILGLLFSFCVSAQIEKAIPKRPNPPKLVNDFTGTLTQQQVDALEARGFCIVDRIRTCSLPDPNGVSDQSECYYIFSQRTCRKSVPAASRREHLFPPFCINTFIVLIHTLPDDKLFRLSLLHR